MPIWGTRTWRIMTLIISIGLLLLGSWLTISAYYSGSPIWWYNLTIIFLGFTLISLVLLIREGAIALNNYQKYGLHPSTPTTVRSDETQDYTSDLEEQIEIQSQQSDDSDH